MKAVVSLTKEEYERQMKVYEDLRAKTAGTYQRDWFHNFRRFTSYGKYEFDGEVSDKLVELLGHEPSEDEIIMLVDNGFGHFGAGCTLNGRKFRGYVYTD